MLYPGRPASPDGRTAHELETYDLLERLGIPFVRVDHDPAMTIADCADVDALLGTEMCKNLFLTNRQGTKFYLLLLPGDKPFHTKDLSAQIGAARLSFADAGHMETYLGVLPGSVTVLGLAYDKTNAVQLLIDRDVIQSPAIGCHPCANTSSLRIATRDLLERFLPAVGHAPVSVTL